MPTSAAATKKFCHVQSSKDNICYLKLAIQPVKCRGKLASTCYVTTHPSDKMQRAPTDAATSKETKPPSTPAVWLAGGVWKACQGFSHLHHDKPPMRGCVSALHLPRMPSPGLSRRYPESAAPQQIPKSEMMPKPLSPDTTMPASMYQVSFSFLTRSTPRLSFLPSFNA